MPYPINQRAHQFNSIQSVPVSFGLLDTALKFLSSGPRNDVTDHLVLTKGESILSCVGLALDNHPGSSHCTIFYSRLQMIVAGCKESRVQ